MKQSWFPMTMSITVHLLEQFQTKSQEFCCCFFNMIKLLKCIFKKNVHRFSNKMKKTRTLDQYYRNEDEQWPRHQPKNTAEHPENSPVHRKSFAAGRADLHLQRRKLEITRRPWLNIWGKQAPIPRLIQSQDYVLKLCAFSKVTS